MQKATGPSSSGRRLRSRHRPGRSPQPARAEDPFFIYDLCRSSWYSARYALFVLLYQKLFPLAASLRIAKRRRGERVKKTFPAPRESNLCAPLSPEKVLQEMWLCALRKLVTSTRRISLPRSELAFFENQPIFFWFGLKLSKGIHIEALKIVKPFLENRLLFTKAQEVAFKTSF